MIDGGKGMKVKTNPGLRELGYSLVDIMARRREGSGREAGVMLG